MRPPPNLAEPTEPTERAAYRRELRRVALGWRTVGLSLLALSAGIIAASPGRRGEALALFAVALVLLIAAVIKRTRYHARRMRGEA